MYVNYSCRSPLIKLENVSQLAKLIENETDHLLLLYKVYTEHFVLFHTFCLSFSGH
jgi:hypothetical protein